MFLHYMMTYDSQELHIQTNGALQYTLKFAAQYLLHMYACLTATVYFVNHPKLWIDNLILWARVTSLFL